MDPYLEAPSIWPGVHSRLIAAMSEHLTAKLAPRYFVDVERRVYLLGEDDEAYGQIVPDLTVLRRRGPRAAPESGALQAPTILFTALSEVEVREPHLVVYALPSRAVVTIVELLSPTNKTTGSRGRQEYLAKRREVLASRTHLVEIDLLRGGARIPSSPAFTSDYYVHVSRVSMRPQGEIYGFSLREPIPSVPIPLSEKDPDTILELGQVVTQTYERARYDLLLDYKSPPDPPLRAEDTDWAQGVVEK
jgi:hypothetical protein